MGVCVLILFYIAIELLREVSRLCAQARDVV